MLPCGKIVILALILILKSSQNECYQLSNYIKIDDVKYNGSSNEIIYKSKISLAQSSQLSISINGINYNNYGFAVFQTHCLHHNITISVESANGSTISQYGTNIGFLMKTDTAQSVFRLSNNNSNEVHCIVALIAYTKASPYPGSCDMEINGIKMLKLIESENFLTVVVPIGREHPSISCEDSKLTYETYYTYLDAMNFGVDAYFEGIEKMMFNGISKTYQAKHVPLSNKHLLETIPGRGIIINTVIRGRNGEVAYHIPVATYSCPQNTWSAHCTETNFFKRGISIVLVIHAIVMILNLMSPDFIESILNGMLFGGLGTIVYIKANTIQMQSFDNFVIVIICSFFVSAMFGTVTLYLPMGRFLSKFTFSLILATYVIEIFFSSFTSAYLQVITALILSILLSLMFISFSVFLGCFILILNFSYLLKIGNLHRVILNNFLAITTLPSEISDETYFDFIRPNYINYRISMNFIDYGLIAFYFVASFFLTFRKERFFAQHPSVVDNENIFNDSVEGQEYNCEVARQRREQCIVGIRRSPMSGRFRVISRCRRHLHFQSGVINERSPLISHWVSESEDERLYGNHRRHLENVRRNAEIRSRLQSMRSDNIDINNANNRHHIRVNVNNVDSDGNSNNNVNSNSSDNNVNDDNVNNHINNNHNEVFETPPDLSQNVRIRESSESTMPAESNRSSFEF